MGVGGLDEKQGRHGKHGDKKCEDDEIVATHTALQLAAQWLGVSADDVLGDLQGVDKGEGGRGPETSSTGNGMQHQAYPGLGFGTKKASFVSKSKVNSAWNRKVDERLLSQKRKKGRDGAGREERNRGGSESESDGGEGSRVAMVGKKQKTAMTRDELLRGGVSKKKRRKR